jgi:hypothetical protein
MNVGVDDAMCFWRSLNVSSNPFPIVVECFNVFRKKIICVYSLKLSLLSWNLGGGIDASNLI